MAYPSTPYPVQPVTVTSSWRTLISEFDGGKESRRKKWTFPKRSVKLIYDGLTETDFSSLWAYYQAASGDYSSFSYVFQTAQHWYGEYLGIGNASTKIFDLRSLSTAAGSVTAYVSGVETGITLLTGGGTDSSDRIEFAAAPALGSVITANFNGRLRMTCRYANPSMDAQLFALALFSTGIDLREVR